MLRSGRFQRNLNRRRLSLTYLEGRLAPAVFTVTNTNGNSLGSLRQAILDANATPNVGGIPDQISFNIPGGGVQTLHPNAPLPVLTEAVIIDGYTQSGASANTLAVGDNAVLQIEIDCSSIPSSNDLFTLGSDGSTIRGLIINHEDGYAINTSGSISFFNNTITGNFIGTNASGGVYQAGTNNGIHLVGSGNHIGGTTVADRNVITGPGGIFTGTIILENGSSNFIQGNYIGVNAAGTAPLQPPVTSIWVNSASGGNTISGNVVVGTSVGVFISGSGTGGNLVQGNFIGTNAAGTAGLGGGTGIDVQTAGDTIIGNLISGNATGIWIAHIGDPGPATIIRGNKIGTDITGTSAIPNTSDGIFASSNFGNGAAIIGGTGPSDGNTIAFNGRYGVSVDNDSGWSILGNSIFANGKRGIRLHNGPSDIQTVNDPSDADTGTNGLQNYPVLTSAATGAGTTTIAGTLNSTPNTTFRIEFFASDVADPTGFGEGKTFLGFTSITTNASGDASFSVSFPVVAGNVITATATDPGGNTSEFSHFVPTAAVYVVTNSNANGPGSLRQAVIDAEAMPNNLGVPDEIRFNIPGPGVHVIQPSASLPNITAPVIIDGYTQPGASVNTLTVGDNAVLQIEIDGSTMPAANLFNIKGDGSTIRGLVINHVPGICFDIIAEPGGNNNTIVGNFIGTDAGGSTYQGSTVIDAPAIQFLSSSGLFATGNRIGGTAPADRNVITSAGAAMILLSSAFDNLIQGNYIGVTRDGKGRLQSPFVSTIGVGIGIFAHDNTIGGNSPGAGNVILGTNIGVALFESSTGGNVIRGNFIGTNATGDAPLFGGTGIFVNTVGGVVGDAIVGNLISGNVTGIESANGSPGPTIQGNKIGTNVTGTLPVPNSADGITVSGVRGPGPATIGGTGPGEGNTIAFNGRHGVLMASGQGRSFLGNSIHSNDKRGIRLLVDGNDLQTVNDPGDADSGPNGLQNFPVITSASIAAGKAVVNGTFNSTPTSSFRIEFFASDSADPSGFGEGKRFLGVENVFTDASGDVTFTADKLGAISAGEVVTATATNLTTNDTSEFAKAFTLAPPPPCVVNNTIIINGGATQRSRVTDITIPFDQLIALPANPAEAFEVKRQSDGASAGVLIGADNSTGKTVVTLRPSGALSESGSWQDGRYTLTIFASQVSGSGGLPLDGNCDSTGGDNFTLIGSPANGLFRLFGDADGNGAITAADFNAFRLAYGSTGPSIFDFDGDNQVSASDFNSFRTRYGVTI